METADQNTDMSCVSVILLCLGLAVVYVASLYVWRNPCDREHPSTIKRRFFSVFIVCLISPTSLYFGMNEKYFEQATFLELLGIRWAGLIQAIVIPLLLTMILYLGPLCVQGFSGLRRLCTQSMYRIGNIRTLTWWRSQVVAPLTEEWTFRACMLPLLLQCFAPLTAIFVCSLFFGVAHFHHIVYRLKEGMPLKHAVSMSCFHVGYTTVFGAYAAFLFVKTGHLVAPLTVHSFCNGVEFPDLSMAFKDPLRKFSLFVLGLVSFCFLLMPMTDPKLFHNELFWNKNFV
ncbi:ras converting CAAX endopeptidase Sras isoform X1 [Megalopta genalis]|uniref:ras converting CAAX endopeptidase Sras isoform X1 n=2 Tax=Megalopta genalis TaxID=115081 RepID=UPI001443401F|nr:CAAX prenyl protease 2 isoform X1 [Megalopta genalis]